ncbi:MAG: hypothetical protein ACHRHE_24175 [Tepidisphaerales bacterium]
MSPRDFTLVVDWSKDKGVKEESVPVAVDGLGLPAAIPGDAIHADGWNRLEVSVTGGRVAVTVNGKTAVVEQALPPQKESVVPVLRLLDPGHPVRFCNVMRIDPGAKRP